MLQGDDQEGSEGWTEGWGGDKVSPMLLDRKKPALRQWAPWLREAVSTGLALLSTETGLWDLWMDRCHQT